MTDKPQTKRSPENEKKLVRTPSSNPVHRVKSCESCSKGGGSEPVLDGDVVIPSVSRVHIQFIRAVNGNHFLHIAEQFLEVHDVPVGLVIAIQPVGAANGLEQVMIVQFVVEVNGKVQMGASNPVNSLLTTISSLQLAGSREMALWFGS